ncbi:MAG: hypothetical protein ACAI34_04715, partial [Verrucomicrobium sp.]
TFFFLPGMFWSVVLGLIALSFTVMAVISPGEKTGGFGKADEPGEQAFEAANRKVTSKKEGVAHGNNPEATKLAAEFASKLKSLRDLGVETSKKKSLSLSGGEFITYCHLTEDVCAFLVYVPELRKYTQEAKDFIGEAAWGVAQHCVGTLPDKPEQVAVGLLGIALYDRVLTGSASEADAKPTVHDNGLPQEVLYPFFETKGAAAVVATGEQIPPTAPKSVEPAPPVAQQDAPIVPPTTPEPATASVPPKSMAATETPSAPSPLQATLPTPVRDWKSADGRVLRASLERFGNKDGVTAFLKREGDGLVFEIPLEKLAPEIQEELKAFSQGAAPAVAPK